MFVPILTGNAVLGKTSAPVPVVSNELTADIEAIFFNQNEL
jgi:hypothetical protein